MIHALHTIRATREILIRMTASLTEEQWNTIPPGFSNNIVWNMGHLVATQITIGYRRAGIPDFAPESFVEAYRSGSKPNGYIKMEEIEAIKGLFLSSADQLTEDYQSGKFDNYEGFTTRFGLALNNIDEALHFMLYHEGLHAGVVNAMKKLV